jgi:tetratricopeptide (TPR) repeat protein
MRRVKETILATLLLIAICTFVYFLYKEVLQKTNRELTKKILELSPKGGPPETIDGLRKAIAIYEDQIERNVREGAQTGTYWKILGIRLADKNMHNDALEAFEKAIYFNTEDPTIYYLTGLSAASAAKSQVGFSPNAEKEKARLFKLAENSYLRSLELDATYAKPMYGLGILYVFELDRPLDAIPHLERYLNINVSDTSAMFILARAYYTTGKYDDALDCYDRIINKTKDRIIKEEALKNKDIIQGMLYE